MSKYTTVGRALEVIAQPLGLTVKANREELVEKLNMIRSLMYSAYVQFQVAVDREECFEVKSYYLGCEPGCNSYRGITLPYDACSSEGLKIYGMPIGKSSAYTDARGAQCVQAWDVVTPAPTQNEIPCDTSGQLLIKGSKEDAGKWVKIHYRTCTGYRVEERLIICEKEETKMAASWIDSVALETGRKGKVNLWLRRPEGTNDCKLSTYRRSEFAPAYKRIRINLCAKECPDHVKVIYSRNYLDLYDDDELVETDSIFALREFAAYLAINSRPNNSGSDAAEGARHLAQATNALVGTQHRDESVSQAHVWDVKSGLPRHSGLCSKRRRAYYY